jgi:uncharacterized cupredoxin-like copper-binding protein
MGETENGMAFSEAVIEVKRGEQILFVLENIGELEHEFVLGTTKENEEHALLMQRFPEMEHDDPFAKRLQPKNSNELLWHFTKPGSFEFGCLIPGHRESGMIGRIVVR